MELELGGKRYPITAGENTIGTARGCAIVVAGDGVRPRHAVVYKSPVGAAVRATAPDASIRVNGALVGTDPRVIRHGDTIAVGSVELAVIDPDAARGGAEGPSDEAVMVAPSGATYRLADTMHGMPAAAWGQAAPVGVAAPVDSLSGSERRSGAADGPALASFLVRSGEQKGQRFTVRRPAAIIGRASASDVAIKDPTVSSEHALLRRKDGLWMLSDVGSTNGTYVDGERVVDESPLVPGATVRVGDVALMFEPYDEPAGDEAVVEEPAAAETVGLARTVDLRAEAAEPAAMPPTEPSRARPTPVAQADAIPPRGLPGWVVAAVIVAAIAGAAVGFVLLR